MLYKNETSRSVFGLVEAMKGQANVLGLDDAFFQDSTNFVVEGKTIWINCVPTQWLSS